MTYHGTGALGLTPDEQYEAELKAWQTKKTSMGYACGSTKAAWAAGVATETDRYERAMAAYNSALATYTSRKQTEDANKLKAKSLGAQYGFTPPASGCITAAQRDAYTSECARASTVLRGLGATSTVPACGQKLLPVCGTPPGVKPTPPAKPAFAPEPTCPPVPPAPVKPKAPTPSSPPIRRDPPAAPPEDAGSLMIGGVLLLLVAGGTGYAVYRHHKKKGKPS